MRNQLFTLRIQTLAYFECAESDSWHVLNVHRATPGLSMMSLEQDKDVSNWDSAKNIHISLANRNKGLMLMLLLEYFECA
jgi:hypothetical protein